MHPVEFVKKWRGATLTERSAAQQHFLDLCRVLDVPTPADVDRHGQTYTFEKGLEKSSGGQGWADLWYRGHFTWEYKSPNKDLDRAVRAAYGWPTTEVVEDVTLARLLELNHERAGT
jgi:hypothetical protein